jgi:ABC-type glycerol-3-phosphate transport system substrate-binding protein
MEDLMQDAEFQSRHGDGARGRRVARRGFVIRAGAFGLSTAALLTAACSPPSAPAAPPPAPGKADAPAKPAAQSAPPAPPAASAAGQSAAAPAAKAGARTVSMWWEGKLPFEEKLRDEQVADFQKKNPDIAINRTLQADIQKAVIPGFSTGTGPDVTQTEGDFPMRKGLVDGSYIIPLDQ